MNSQNTRVNERRLTPYDGRCQFGKTVGSIFFGIPLIYEPYRAFLPLWVRTKYLHPPVPANPQH